MRTYRISPSLLNSFMEWLNADEMYAKFWGNSETPAMTAEQYERQKLQELLDYINRKPQPLNEAADRGTCLNEIVDGLIGGGGNPNVTWDKVDDAYVAHRNGFTFVFDPALVDHLALTFRNAIPQFHLSHTYDLGNRRVELHGYSDYIFQSMIWDLKTTERYECEKYACNWQRHVYPVVAVDAGDMMRCDNFTFYAVEMRKDRDGRLTGKPYKETYDVNIEQSRGMVLETLNAVILPQLDAWYALGKIPGQTIINDVK